MDPCVIIIGSGAGGGTLALALAPSGLSILILERGDYLPREPANWDAETAFNSHRYHTDERWLDGAGRRFTPVTGYHVGGNTKFYGAAISRRRLADFGVRRHVDGETPAWPFGYDDLAPYYAQAEAWYFAHGEAGADPTEPPRAAYQLTSVRWVGLKADVQRTGVCCLGFRLTQRPFVGCITKEFCSQHSSVAGDGVHPTLTQHPSVAEPVTSMSPSSRERGPLAWL